MVHINLYNLYMDIKRKKKPYSEKLYNELILFYLLRKSGYFYEYEASFLIKVSNRTLRRYIHEINETCILHRDKEKLKIHTENGYKSYHVYSDFYNENSDPLEDLLYPNVALLPIGFCQKHPKGLDSQNQHIVKLTRCALLLHCANNEFRKLNEHRWRKPEDMIYNCLKYYFFEMEFDVSIKTFERDMKLVIDVIKSMKDK